MRLPPTARTTRSTLGAIAAGALLLGGASTASAGVGAQPARTATTAKAAAYTATAADVRMKAALASRATTARFGTLFSGTVIDAASNAYIWGKNSNSYRLPASTNKLVTATNALTVFGPDKRWTTQVRAGSRAEHVILVGAGDPSLSSTSLEAMARTTATALLSQRITAAKVYVDDDVFPTPTLAYGWKASYVPDSIAPVRGLVRDQRNTTDTSADAGAYFRDRLKAHGVTGAVYSGRANAASGARVIASSTGSSLASIVQSMLLNSDNEVAEALHKLVGRQLGFGATWAGARTAQAQELAAQNLRSGNLYDGSGLSRADRITTAQQVQILDRAVHPGTQATLWPLKGGLPTAGRTGTLASRFTTAASKCAVGRVFAKTGTLSDVVSLAGWTTGADGRVKVFAFLVNGKTSSTTLMQNVDMLAATVTGCY
jgi:D-alanyl-D-alanine carboxypeptidase/D-alanyl-D-alanine-endopeptidase (penicillin-binding protein 4)